MKNKKSINNAKNYNLNKIIYFDKETIKNILQECNHGIEQSVTNSNTSTSIKNEAAVESDAGINFNLPILARIKFVFTSKLSAEYISAFDKSITITSTELSNFEKIKVLFTEFNNITVSDIENSATFYRVAGNYTRILKSGIKDVDIKEFKNVMESYEGYDHYKINESTYVRFNSNAFLSNYKRNDLLNSRLKIYGISVGKFTKEDFNFIEQLNKMQSLSTGTVAQTLAEVYPTLTGDNESPKNIKTNNPQKEKTITLYDIVYASILHQEDDNENS